MKIPSIIWCCYDWFSSSPHQRPSMIWLKRHLDLATTLWLKALIGKGSSSKGPASVSSKKERQQRLQNIIIIMSRYCEDMIRIIKRLTRQDDNDNHHRRRREDIRKEDIKEQEPNDKKTRLTASTTTSSIIDHIRFCAISQFSCGPGGGEKLFDPWAFGRKGQECPREIRAKKFMFMLFFSSLRECNL